MWTASRAVMLSAANSAVADAMTGLMMCAMLRMAPLFDGMSAVEERKKWLPAQLHACGSLR
jgi:hypothetical protein